MRERITVRLPEKLLLELEREARAERVSKSAVIRRALARYIAVKKFRILRKRVLPIAQLKDIITDEDVFSAIQ